jgi:nucleoside-diphosphate-sugar epimerase
MRILVTGGTGFLGSHLVEQLLKQGHEVIALARTSSNIGHLKTTSAKIVMGDIEDYNSLRPAMEGVDIVYHAAARVTPGWGSWELFHSSIVKGTENMLRASADAGVSRFLHISTGTVYGKHCEGDTAACESTECHVDFSPDSYYDYAKLQAEKIAFEYYNQGKIPVSMVRIGVIYGPRDRLLADRVFRQISLPIIVWPGELNPRYSVVYVSDAVELAILATTSNRAIGQVYNVAGKEMTRLRDFAAAMVEAMGSKKTQVTIPYTVGYTWCSFMERLARLRRSKEMPFLTRSAMKFLNKGLYLDGAKARDELGWEPKVSIEDGTRLYVEWRRAQHKKY